MVSAEPFPGKWGLAQSPSYNCGQRQTMNHTFDTCPLIKLEGGLNLLHDDDAVIWLESTATEARDIIICSNFLHRCDCQWLLVIICHSQNVKVAHTRLLSIGFQSRFRFLAVSLQVRWVINLAVSYHYFPPGLQLPSQPLREMLPVSLLGEQRHDGWEQFA